MSLWTKIIGTIETKWQLGLGGPQWKASAGVIEARNSADAAYAIGRGATPVGANDWTTKAYVDAGPGGTTQVIRYAITTAATQDSATAIPAAAVILRARVNVVTPYDGGTTISVGQAGSLTLFQATTDNLATVAGIYEVPQETASFGALAVRTTIAGAPAAGAGFVLVEYCVPNA